MDLLLLSAYKWKIIEAVTVIEGAIHTMKVPNEVAKCYQNRKSNRENEKRKKKKKTEKKTLQMLSIHNVKIYECSNTCTMYVMCMPYNSCKYLHLQLKSNT